MISLRDAVDGDLDVLQAHQADVEAARMVAGPPMRDRDGFREHWDRTAKNPGVRLRVIVFEGLTAGYVGCFVNDGVPEVCYWLGREFWGKGIASRALALYLAEDTRRPLTGRVAKRNPASVRVLEKCGFKIVREDLSPYDGAEVEGYLLKLE